MYCVNQTGTGCDASFGSNCFASVQDAVNAAPAGSEIRIAGGTYAPGGTVATITKEMVLRGGFDSSCSIFDSDLYHTVLDAGWAGSVISMTNVGEVTLARSFEMKAAPGAG